jgi:FAD/FMN-containing dehydrogenase
MAETILEQGAPVAATGKPLRPVIVATRDGGERHLDAPTLARFRASLRGPMLFPADPGFREATLLWNGMIHKTPALVVQPTGTADVVAAVDFARDEGLLISVRGGGHNIAGTAIADGGLTLDMSRMRAVIVDERARLARVQPGCLLGDVDRETQLHGLATVLGFISETGVAGLTLGGGMGYLSRRFGYSVDNLLEVELVTADGQLRRASRQEHPDLFWAIRGAGANLGVVTSFTFQLHPVGPQVYGGLIAFPFERAEEVMAAYQRLTAQAPRELTCFLLLLRAPPAPFVPPAWHGRQLCAMSLCYSGAPARVDEVLAPLRSLGEPVVDLLGHRPYTQLQSYLDATEPKGNHYYWKTEFIGTLSDELLATLRETFADCPVPGAEVGLLHIGGALNDHPADDGAVGNRDAQFAVGVTGMWEPGEPDAAAFRQWVRDAWAGLRRFSTGGNYINFQTADEGPERIAATYGANFPRLMEIKAKYDPQNVFRSNRNVASSGSPPLH